MLNSNKKIPLCAHEPGLHHHSHTTWFVPQTFTAMFLWCLRRKCCAYTSWSCKQTERSTCFLLFITHYLFLLLQPERWTQTPSLSAGVRCDWPQAVLTNPLTHPYPPPQNTHRVLHSPVFSSPSAGSRGKQTGLGAFFLEVCYCQEETRPI